MLNISFQGHNPASSDAGGMSLRQQLEHALDAIGFTRGHRGIVVGAHGIERAPDVSVSSADKPHAIGDEHLGEAPEAEKPAAAPEQAEPTKPRRGRPPKAAEPAVAHPEQIPPPAEPTPQISTSPEDRKPPEEPAAALTHDDVRQAIGAYGQKFGDEVAVKNGRTFMGLLPGQKIPEIPADRIAAVVAALRGAIASGKPEPASAVDDLG